MTAAAFRSTSNMSTACRRPTSSRCGCRADDPQPPRAAGRVRQRGMPATIVRADPLPLIPLPGDVPAPEFALPDLEAGRTGLPIIAAVRCSSASGRSGVRHAGGNWRRSPLCSQADDAGSSVLAINVGDSGERIREFLADNPAPGLPVLLDTDKSVATAWHVIGLPCAYGVSTSGEVRLGALGEREWTAPALKAQLRRLL